MNALNKLRNVRNTQNHPKTASPKGYMRDNPEYQMYSIGEYTYGEPTVLKWDNEPTLSIGKFCSIAPGVVMILGGEHKLDWITTYPFWTVKDLLHDFQIPSGTKGGIIIENDVWIGANSLILSGVRIENGAVVGAGSVVTKNVEPYAIVAGNPAKMIRKRFDQKTVAELLRIKWWDWDIQRIKEDLPLLLSNKTNEFTEKNEAKFFMDLTVDTEEYQKRVIKSAGQKDSV